jgi:hypothetical protein
MRTIRRPFTVSCLATWLAAGAGIATAQTVAVDNDDIGGNRRLRNALRENRRDR